jgi:RNA polymerase sigma-B factor
MSVACSGPDVTAGHLVTPRHVELFMQSPQTTTKSTSSAYAPGSDLDTYLATTLWTIGTLPDDDPARHRLRDEVICACLPVVRRLASRFHGRGETPDDLTQVATVGLIKAVDRFDVTRETQFLSYATPTIIGEIKRHFRDRGWSIRVSRSTQELYLDINRVLPDLAQTLGRSPGVADIARHLGVDEERVIEGLEAGHAYRTRSLSAPVGTDESAGTLADLLGAEDPEIEAVADRTTLRCLLRDVPERERGILAMRFFSNMTQAEIAARIGVSQMHVSRLLARALHDLRVRMLATD